MGTLHTIITQKLQGKGLYLHTPNYSQNQGGYFSQADAFGSVSFKQLSCISYCVIILWKLHISSKKEQQNHKTREREEFKHTL